MKIPRVLTDATQPLRYALSHTSLSYLSFFLFFFLSFFLLFFSPRSPPSATLFDSLCITQLLSLLLLLSTMGRTIMGR
jgi:hypothetical protein